MTAKAGDKVNVKCNDKEYIGTLIDKKELVTVIKLENGYNVGIDNSRIKSIEVLEEGKDIKIDYSSNVKKKEGLPNISILHTGGTIASKVDYRTGAVYSSFNPEDLLGLFPELATIANFDSTLISNMWSDDLRFDHLGLIADAIKAEVSKGVNGIIVGIGTDNLSVAAAGLAFIVEKSPIPIIFVGAQRSSDRGSSDAAMNLICAAKFIADSDFKGVGICMHSGSGDDICSILPACKTKKLHSSRRDAFKPVNDSIIANINYTNGKIKFNSEDYNSNAGELVIKKKLSDKVGMLKIHVNMDPSQFSFYKGWKGLIIEGTGLGHTPGQVPTEVCAIHKDIYPAIKEVIDSGCVIVMTTNCVFGRVNLNVYDKGRDLINLGIISGEDMLSDTALVKLSWLLANYTIEESKKLISTNLRGEINQNISEKDYLEE